MSSLDRRTVFRRSLWAILVALLVLAVGVGLQQSRSRPPRPAPQVISYLPGFLLTNADGREIRLDDLAVGPWVADFVFTRCPGPCPLMSQKMAELGKRLPAGVRRVSFTVDPEHDTPAVLRDYATRFGAGPDWLFLSGDRAAIWELSVSGFKLGVAPADDGGPPDQGPVIHSTRFVLVDAEGGVRGYYDPFDPAEMDRLVGEVAAVLREPPATGP